MEGEVREQVAAPIYMHQSLPGRFCEPPSMSKKRDLPWQNNSYHQSHQQVLQLHHHHQQQQFLLNSSLHQNNNPKNHWNPNFWAWDSVTFMAKPKPTETSADALRLGSLESEAKKKGEVAPKPPLSNKSSVEDDGESLALKLGGGGGSLLPEEPVVRPNKRVRSGSPGGGGGSYPMCQVDDCGRDLTDAKDYHRRHKVCELHSKTTKALVGQQMQRFCQQCSRFHPLSEFDEGKRSCRRRLAGHNRRRRKTQPEDVSSRLLIPGNPENSNGGNLDIINVLTILARLQGNNADKTSNSLSIPDKDRLIQILSKINSLPASGNSSARLPVPGGFDLNISHTSQVPLEHPPKVNGISNAPSTTELLAVLSAALAASSPDALAILSQFRSHSNGDDKSKVNCLEQEAGFNVQKKPAFPSVGLEKTSSFQSPVEVSEGPVQESRQGLALQLFSSSAEDDSPPKLGSTRKYFSSDSSNPMEERSPSSSPPVEQKLFPLHSSAEAMKHARMSICREDDATTESRTSCGWNPTFELFRGSNRRAENGGAVSNLPYQSGYSSSSSDHSPSSSNSGSQDRTGRIIFKLFEKDPSDFPVTLRTQILNWLSHSPSEMESYIRPGCVVLSVYASLPLIAWEELHENLLRHVNLLVQDPDTDFWRTGRFLIHTDRQLVSHKDGKIRLSKSWKTWNAPEVVSVSPLAVVAGKEASLVLRGRNLTLPGTKIHCAYMGGYTSKEYSGSPHSGTIYDDSSMENFDFPGGDPNVFGRCFIEVENGFKGNSFPVIIADATICRELRVLESELEEDVRLSSVSEDQTKNFGHPRLRTDVLHFLNELGWFFQRQRTLSRTTSSGFSSARLKFLFAFSVERDWSALVKALLDIVIKENSGIGCSSRELVEAQGEIHILSTAVKRKCRKMVNLLLHYSVTTNNDISKKYLFPPNQAGPGGLTPLHLAACMQDSEEMVDELTNDPQDIGLSCWNSLLDANGQSPYAYALMRNYQSYNQLVARKLVDKRNNQVSLTVENPEISLDQSWAIEAERDKPNPPRLQGRSCAQCAVVSMRHVKRMPRSQGLLHRPYVHSMLAIAAVCVCVCLFLRGSPDIGSVAPFKWENVNYGPR